MNFKNNKMSKYRSNDTVPVMIGGGDKSFIRVKKGTKIRTTHGYYIAGETKEERKNRMENKINNIVYSKPKPFCKRLGKIKKRTI